MAEEAAGLWVCPYDRIDCGGAGRYIAHLQWGHGVVVEPPVYKAVTPKIEATDQEISALDKLFSPHLPFRIPLEVRALPEADYDGIASPFADSAYDALDEQKMDGGAVLSVDPNTGAAKGVKLARYLSIPQDALLLLAEHYGKGEAKYPSDPDGTPNWSKGYAWSLSLNAAARHLAQFMGGEDVDAETGTLHTIAVAWHMMALTHYLLNNKGTDDRWEKSR